MKIRKGDGSKVKQKRKTEKLNRTNKEITIIERKLTEEYKEELKRKNKNIGMQREKNEMERWKISLHNVNGLTWKEEKKGVNKLRKIQMIEIYMNTSKTIIE